jgi:hypothetical protein
MDKNITLVIPGTGDEATAHDAPIKPGTTAAELLRAAGKSPQDWGLQLRRGEGFQSLAAGDDLYGKVSEGEKVFATPQNIVVG